MNEIKTTNDKITKLKITPLKLLIPTIKKEKVSLLSNIERSVMGVETKVKINRKTL